MGRIFSAAYRPTAQMPFKQTFRSRQPAQMVFNWSLFPRPLGLLATGCFLLALANTAQGLDVVTCKTSPETVAAGENVSVTFNFPYDVSQMRMVTLTVHRFPSNEFDPIVRERVFQCLKLDAPNLSCNTTSEGYSLEGEVKSSLNLRITDVSPEHSGRFICSVMSSERNIPETEPCLLLVRDVLDVSTTTTTEPAKPAVTTDLGGQDVLDVSATTTTEPAKPAVTTDLGGQGSDRNDGETTTSWMIPVIIISVMLPLIIFVSIFAIFRRRKSRRADEKNGEDDEGEEKTDGGRGDSEGGAGKDDNDKDAGEENEDKEPLMDAVRIG